MSNAIQLAQDDEPLKPGQIRFTEAALPPLPSGTYRLTAQQLVEGLKEMDEPPAYNSVLPFQIQGPRFTLAPNDLQMVMPPANQTGSWENVLPNVVLRRPTLPWSRTLDGSVPPAGEVSTPWVGIISVTAEELGGGAGAIAAPAPVSTAKVSALTDPPAGTLGPDLVGVSAAEKDTSFLMLELDTDLFQSVAPTVEDLSWLAHIREVNTDNKEILGLDEDGTFSVVVGNRTIQAGQVNYVFMVSLEGQQGYLPPNSLPSGATRIRFATLAWWKVQAEASKGDFIEIMQALPDNGGVDLTQLPHTPITGSDPGSQEAAMGLGMGYVPLTYRMRDGEAVTGWYRGPASAVPTKPDGLGPYLYSDKAIRYDPVTGLFDLSQAAAWQIGRLLALADATFARQMFEWRRAVQSAVSASVALDALLTTLPASSREAVQSASATVQPGHKALSRLAATAALAGSFAALSSRPAAIPTADGEKTLTAIPMRVRREDRAHAAGTARHKATLQARDTDPLDALMDRVFGASDTAGE